MAPPYRKPPPDPDAPPRVGGYVTYRKAGYPKRRALIEWIYLGGGMRVRNETGWRVSITDQDIARAAKEDA